VIYAAGYSASALIPHGKRLCAARVWSPTEPDMRGLRRSSGCSGRNADFCLIGRGVGRLEQERPSVLLESPDPLWTGNLTVTFPGAPEVALIGPSIRARLNEVL
jgi:hypothetical protein